MNKLGEEGGRGGGYFMTAISQLSRCIGFEVFLHDDVHCVESTRLDKGTDSQTNYYSKKDNCFEFFSGYTRTYNN